MFPLIQVRALTCTGSDIEANLGVLLSKSEEATPRFESRRAFTEEDTILLHKAVQEEGVSFTSRAAIHESTPMARKELSKEPAWRAVEDLPDIPKMLYQLAGECDVSFTVVLSSIVSTNTC